MRCTLCFAKLSGILLLLVTVLSGCSEIHTAPLPSSNVEITRNPEHIYIAPFRTETAKWLVGDDREKDGFDVVHFKEDFQTQFTHELIKRLTKLAPTDPRWIDDLPDHGWLITGDFVTVYQGSRFLRTAVGLDYGQTYLQTNVYVYDLDKSKTQYVFAFRTGVPDAKGEGVGSGTYPGMIALNPLNFGYGLKLDTVKTCRAIRNVLAQYCDVYPADMH